MAQYTERLSEQLAIVATIDPSSQSAGALNSTSVDSKLYRRVLFILSCGVLGASATVDMKLQGSADNSTWADISGKSITQLTKASNDANKAEIEITGEELATLNYRYVRAVVTVGTAASLTTLIGLADNARYKPANANNLTTVAQIVA